MTDFLNFIRERKCSSDPFENAVIRIADMQKDAQALSTSSSVKKMVMILNNKKRSIYFIAYTIFTTYFTYRFFKSYFGY